MNKSELYAAIDKLRLNLDYDNARPISSFELFSRCRNILLYENDFKTTGLRGMVFIGDISKPHVIILNSNRNIVEKNYDEAHELMHIFFHRNISLQTFQCIDSPKFTQNSYLEWQANEGAAELLVPYRALLPLVKEMYCGYFEAEKTFGLHPFCEWASQKFFVTARVIEIRLNSLKYEIDQYLNGVPIDNIQILSNNQQQKRGIIVQSLAEKEDIKLSKALLDWQTNRLLSNTTCTETHFDVV